MLQAQLGGVRVLTRPGERRVWVLDAGAAILWDLCAAGLSPETIAVSLAQRFDLDIDTARIYLREHYDSWRSAGLLEQLDAPVGPENPASEPLAPSHFCVFETLTASPPPRGVRPVSGTWWLGIAQQTVAVHPSSDRKFRAILEPLLAPLRISEPPYNRRAIADQLILAGDTDHWRLSINGVEVRAGSGRDIALVATLSALTELGCRTRERLLVLHGAGLVSPEGHCLLLVAPGGSGKTTLAMALEAVGYRLLSDDVVPIGPDGAAFGLGLPACLKTWSLPVLAGCRPDLMDAPEVIRFGQSVRFLPPRNRPVGGALAPDLLLFPEYRPDSAPCCAPLRPEQALQGVIEAQAVIRNLTQGKLEALCGWVSALPAYSLNYSNLADGILLVRSLLEKYAVSASITS